MAGRVQNNNYEKDGVTVYSMAFTAEEIDYLDTKAAGDALRAKQGSGPDEGRPAPQRTPAPTKAGKGAKGRKSATVGADADDDIPF